MAKGSRFGIGNYTRGEGRRGYRGGRKSVYDPTTPTRTATIVLSEHLYIAAILFGRGNASRGIRVALESLAALMPRLPEGESRARFIWMWEPGPNDVGTPEDEHMGWRRSVMRALAVIQSAADPARLELVGRELGNEIEKLRQMERMRVRVENQALNSLRLGKYRATIAGERTQDAAIARQIAAGCTHGTWTKDMTWCSVCRHGWDSNDTPLSTDSESALPEEQGMEPLEEHAAPPGIPEYDLFSDSAAPSAPILPEQIRDDGES